MTDHEAVEHALAGEKQCHGCGKWSTDLIRHSHFIRAIAILADICPGCDQNYLLHRGRLSFTDWLDRGARQLTRAKAVETALAGDVPCKVCGRHIPNSHGIQVCVSCLIA